MNRGFRAGRACLPVCIEGKRLHVKMLVSLREMLLAFFTGARCMCRCGQSGILRVSPGGCLPVNPSETVEIRVLIGRGGGTDQMARLM